MRTLLFIVAASCLGAGLGACKRDKPSLPIELKGKTGDETEKEINYASFYNVGDKRELKITHVVAFESSHKTASGAQAGNDQGTNAAYAIVDWLKNAPAQELFGSQPKIILDQFLPNRGALRVGGIYQFVARFENVRLTHRPQGAPETTDVVVRVILGTALTPAIGSSRVQAAANYGACSSRVEDATANDHAMPAVFCNELARAFAQDDVVSYNGHIWVSGDERPTDVTESAPVGPTTLRLARRIQEFRQESGTRNKQSIIYVNACHAEGIERKLMEALVDPTTADSSMPLLISHRNYSNFGYFATHAANLMIDLMRGESLSKVMLNLTTTTRSTGNESKEEAKERLREAARTAASSNDPKQVQVVVYDVNDIRRTSQDESDTTKL